MASTQRQWLILHTHRFGTSIFQVAHPRKPDVARVVKALDIDFEEDRDDEDIEIYGIKDHTPTLAALETALGKGRRTAIAQTHND